MQLTQHQDGAFSIRKLEADGILIGQQWVRQSFLLTPTRLRDLAINQFADLSPEQVPDLIASAPDVVLLGTGSKQIMPAQALRAAFLTRRIGVEAMDLRAACYTFNVLAQEARDVMLIGFFD